MQATKNPVAMRGLGGTNLFRIDTAFARPDLSSETGDRRRTGLKVGGFQVLVRGVGSVDLIGCSPGE